MSRASRSRASWIGSLAGGLLLAACGRVPDYALPQVREVESATHARADVIRYRALTRSDFRAKGPPARIAPHADRMAAYTCANVTPQEPIPVRIEASGDGFLARAPGLDAFAEMDRSCSWWNDALQTAQPPAYILQHEQIHFGLVEVSARELRARGRALRVRGATIAAAQAGFQHGLEDLRREMAASILRRNTDFDRDTSAVYDARAQQRWYDRVMAELARE